MKKILLTPLLWCALLTSAVFAEDTHASCNPLFEIKSVDDFVNVDQVRHRSLRLLTLNTQGFELNKKNRNDPEYLEKVDQWAQSIVEIDPDITVLQEVFSDFELKYLISEYLNDEYEFFIQQGNDRYSNIAFLTKKNIDLHIETRSYKDRKWKDIRSNKKRNVFTRDAPTLILKDKDSNQVLFALIGHHAKSKRHRRGDKESQRLRTAQHNEVAKIAESLSAEFEAIPIFVAGDFNANLHTADSTRPLLQNMTDVFDLLARPPPQSRRVTHSFFSKKEHIQSQLDGIIVLNSEKTQVRRADVYRYRDEDGNEYPLPETQEERNALPSDHNLVWADILIPIN